MISPESKMHTTDRVLILEPMEGKFALNSQGIVDKRLFDDGENGNKLHAVMDQDSCLWSFKYEKGAVPPAMKGVFTGFKALMKFAENYYSLRNIRIKEVKE